MIEVQLAHGKGIAFIDDVDAPSVLNRKWQLSEATDYPNGRTRRYAVSSVYDGASWKTVRLHRLILGVVNTDVLVDHIDGNGLNCQRSNLRLATSSQNGANIKVARGRSKYKGVSYVSHASIRAKKWKAEIRYMYKGIYLGVFRTEEEAARAYDRKAIELFGEYAHVNFPDMLGER